MVHVTPPRGHLARRAASAHEKPPLNLRCTARCEPAGRVFMGTPEGFDHTVRSDGSVVITHHGRTTAGPRRCCVGVGRATSSRMSRRATTRSSWRASPATTRTATSAPPGTTPATADSSGVCRPHASSPRTSPSSVPTSTTVHPPHVGNRGHDSDHRRRRALLLSRSWPEQPAHRFALIYIAVAVAVIVVADRDRHRRQQVTGRAREAVPGRHALHVERQARPLRSTLACADPGPWSTERHGDLARRPGPHRR